MTHSAAGELAGSKNLKRLVSQTFLLYFVFISQLHGFTVVEASILKYEPYFVINS